MWQSHHQEKPPQVKPSKKAQFYITCSKSFWIVFFFDQMYRLGNHCLPGVTYKKTRIENSKFVFDRLQW